MRKKKKLRELESYDKNEDLHNEESFECKEIKSTESRNSTWLLATNALKTIV